MFAELIVRHCSSTLAGFKTGSLFNYTYTSFYDLQNQIAHWNSALNPKGVHITLLRRRGDKVLIYVYRPKKLAHDIEHDETKYFLMCNGYLSCDIEHCIKQLANRLDKYENFPHEIGLFLGYPLPDVKAFIENEGKNCKCVGCWKVYFNECEAVKTFAKYKKCTNVYCRLFAEGRSILRLTVVA